MPALAMAFGMASAGEGLWQNIIWIFKVMLYDLVYRNLVHIFQSLSFIF